MRVKRFVAIDMPEAMEKIKSQLGNNAVILHTRYFKEGGFLGLFRRNYVEVTAAVDNNRENTTNNGLVVDKDVKELNLVNSDNIMASDLEEMRKMMKDMSFMLDNLGGSKLPKRGKDLYCRLRKQGLDEKIAHRIINVTLDKYLESPVQTPEELNKILFANLLKPLQKIKYTPVKAKSGKPKILTFIGPTGVGKTTTIAKLAAMSAVMEKKKVALITVDTYRIAAVEQLKTIGDIMNVPVNVVFNPENLEKSLREMQDYDVIYIDTAGRSHKNETQVSELKGYLESADSDEIFLVLSSTSKYQDFLDIFDTYRDVKVKSLIFTKLDETSDYGAIYNIIYKEKRPVSYFANGQNIPDDIEVAEADKLVQMLMKEQSNE